MKAKPKPVTGIRRILKAATYSWAGLQATWRGEAAFREELLLSVVMIPLGFWLGETAVEKVLLIGCLFILLIVELLNSAIEAVVDRHGEAYHILAKNAKDMGSAAVLLALINLIVTWTIVLMA
jgi:diacylglycerol kinase (ATP)